jgi:hypothetical protein
MAAPTSATPTENFFSLDSFPSFVRGTQPPPPPEESVSFLGTPAERTPVPPSQSLRPSLAPPPPAPNAPQNAAAPNAAAPAEPEKPKGPLGRVVQKFEDGADYVVSSRWAKYLALAFGVFAFIMLVVGMSVSVANHNELGKIKHLVQNHMNATAQLATFFEVLHITDDMHTKDVQCLTLLAECEALSMTGGDQGMRAQLKRMCSFVVTRCERMVKNHLERLAEITFDAGSCFSVTDSQPFCYPSPEAQSADSLLGLRYDRVGPSSAMFGPLANQPDQSMLNRQEFGVFAAYSFYGVTGASSVNDGITYVSLNATSPSFGRATVMLETPERGWVTQFYADHERILALGLNSNKIYHWDVSASLSLAVPGTTITGADMASGTYTDNVTLSRPWSVRRFSNGDYLVSMLDSNSTQCLSNPAKCGGLMRLSAADMVTNPPAAPSRFDNADPNVATPGECIIGISGRNTVVCGSFSSYDQVLAPDCLDPQADIFDDVRWGSQLWVFSKDVGTAEDEIRLIPLSSDIADLVPAFAPIPTPDWAEDIGGFIPNRVVQLHGVSTTLLSVSTFGGLIAGYTVRLPGWSGAALAWVLPLNGDADDSDDTEAFTTPLVTDAIVSPDDCMLFLASPGLGQILAYSLCAGDASNGIPIPQLCAIHQLTSGFNSTVTYVHPSNPSRPLYGGPANLAVTPDGEFLYASSSSVFDDCLFPDAIAAGGFMVRYKVSSSRCDALSLDIDPGFFVDGNALPGRAGIPARMGAIGFAANDAHFMQRPHTLAV